MLPVMMLCRAFAVESFVIFIVEIAVGEVKGVSFAGALNFFFRGNSIERSV